MHAFSVLSVLLIVTCALANKTEIKKTEEKSNLKDSKFQELEALSSTADESDNKDVKRSKKSTTTTFCVEIRPSGPFQKPFQVCEPAEPAKPSAPAASPVYSAPATSSYYPAPSYGAQEQPKPEAAYSAAAAYKSPTQPKTGAVYSAPVKTYSPPSTPSPKQYAHGMSYSSYRSNSEKSANEEHNGHLMRMSHVSAEEEDNHSDTNMMSDHLVRSASYGLPSYGSSSYGSSGHSSAISYVPVVPKKHVVKHPSHNGLVITCQPNLAGYAHNVPSSLHHPPAVPSYSYHSASSRGYDDRIGRVQVLSHSYGNYQQPQYKAVTNSYKSQSAAHPLAGQGSGADASASSRSMPVQHYGSEYSSTAYASPAPAYNPPRMQPPTSYASSSAYAHSSAPAQLPVQPTYVPQPPPAAQPTQPPSQQQYGQYSQNYPQPSAAPERSPSSTYGQIPTQYQAPASYAPAPSPPAYSPAPAAPPVPSQPSYSQSQSYSSSAPIPTPSSPPALPQNQQYIPPGTYGETEDEHRMQAAPPKDSALQENKEKHTIKKMEEMSHLRAAGTQWVTEMSKDQSKNKNEEKVEMAQQGWSSMRASEQGDDMKTELNRIETDQAAENEVK